MRAVAEYQVTWWRELPSLVVARDGDVQAKAALPQRLQEAIDEAAMRLGDTTSEAYLDGWRRDDWTSADGSPAQVAERVAAELEAAWPPDAVTAYLDRLPGTGTPS